MTHFLEKAGMDYQVVVADEDPETARKYQITTAPTLMVESADGLRKIENVSNIRNFIENR